MFNLRLLTLTYIAGSQPSDKSSKLPPSADGTRPVENGVSVWILNLMIDNSPLGCLSSSRRIES